MSATIRIPRHLYGAMSLDLRRPHPFAAERVGLLFARPGTLSSGNSLLLARHYAPVEDEHYVDDPSSGARIGGQAIRAALQRVLATGDSALHVHLHPHRGRPRWSRTDLCGLPPLALSFRNAAPNAAHGLLLLSDDSATSLLWLPGAESPAGASAISVVGAPLAILEIIT